MRSASQTGHEGVGLLQGVQVPGEMPDPSLLSWGTAVQLESLTEPSPEQREGGGRLEVKSQRPPCPQPSPRPSLEEAVHPF